MIRGAIAAMVCAAALVVACSTTTTVSAPTFTVGTLSESEAYTNGCMTMMRRTGVAPSDGDVYRVGQLEADDSAIAFVRIDGVLIRLNLVSAEITERTIHRVFASADQSTRVVERLRIGAVNEAADSTAHSGVLTITHNGAAQTVRVTGGAAC
jgi:hypothetical protein